METYARRFLSRFNFFLGLGLLIYLETPFYAFADPPPLCNDAPSQWGDVIKFVKEVKHVIERYDASKKQATFTIWANDGTESEHQGEPKIEFPVGVNQVHLFGVGAIRVEMDGDQVILHRVIPGGEGFWPEAQVVKFSKTPGQYEFVSAKVLQDRLLVRRSPLNIKSFSGKGAVTIRSANLTFQRPFKSFDNGKQLAATLGTEDSITTLLTDLAPGYADQTSPEMLVEQYRKSIEYSGTHGKLLAFIVDQVAKIGATDKITEKVKIGNSIFTQVRDRLNADIRSKNPSAGPDDELSIEEAAALGQYLTGNILTNQIGKTGAHYLGELSGVVAEQMKKMTEEGGEYLSILSKFEPVARVVEDDEYRNQLLLSAVKKASGFDLKVKTQFSDENIAIVYLRSKDPESKFATPGVLYLSAPSGSQVMARFKVGDRQREAKVTAANVKFTSGLGAILPEVMVTDHSESRVELSPDSRIGIELKADGILAPHIESSDPGLAIGSNVKISSLGVPRRKEVSLAIDRGVVSLEFERGEYRAEDRHFMPSFYFGIHGSLSLVTPPQEKRGPLPSVDSLLNFLGPQSRLGIENPLFALRKKGIMRVEPQKVSGMIYADELNFADDVMDIKFLISSKNRSPMEIRAEALPLDFNLEDYSLKGRLQSVEDTDRFNLNLDSKSGRIDIPDMKFSDGNRAQVPLKKFYWNMNIQDRAKSSRFDGSLGFTTTGSKIEKPQWLSEAEKAVLKEGEIPFLGFVPRDLKLQRAESKIIFSQQDSTRGNANESEIYPFRIRGGVQGITDSQEIPLWITGQAYLDPFGAARVENSRVGFQYIGGNYDGKPGAQIEGEIPLKAEFPGDGSLTISLLPGGKKIQVTRAGKLVSEAEIRKLEIPTQVQGFFKDVQGGELVAKTEDHEKGLTLESNGVQFSLKEGKLTEIQGHAHIQLEQATNQKLIRLNASLKMEGVDSSGRVKAIGEGEFLYLGLSQSGLPWFVHGKFNGLKVIIGEDGCYHLEFPTSFMLSSPPSLSLTLGQFSEKSELTEIKDGFSLSQLASRLVGLRLFDDDVSIMDIRGANVLGLHKIARMTGSSEFKADLRIPPDGGVKVETDRLPLEVRKGNLKEDQSFAGHFTLGQFSLDSEKDQMNWSDLQGVIARPGESMIRFREDRSSLGGALNWKDDTIDFSSHGVVDYLWRDPGDSSLKMYTFRPEGRWSIDGISKLVGGIQGRTKKELSELGESKRELLRLWRQAELEQIQGLQGQTLSFENKDLLGQDGKSGQIEAMRNRISAWEVVLGQARDPGFFRKNLHLLVRGATEMTESRLDALLKNPNLMRHYVEGLAERAKDARRLLCKIEELARLEENSFQSLEGAVLQPQNQGQLRIEAQGSQYISLWVRPNEYAVESSTLAKFPPKDLSLTDLPARDSKFFIQSERPNDLEKNQEKHETPEFLQSSRMLKHRVINALTGKVQTSFLFRDFREPIAEILWAERGFKPTEMDWAKMEAERVYSVLIRDWKWSAPGLDEIQARKEYFGARTRLEKAIAQYLKIQRSDRDKTLLPQDFMSLLDSHLSSVQVIYRDWVPVSNAPDEMVRRSPRGP